MNEPLATDKNKALSSKLIWLLSVSCAVTVANLYYSQPLLADMAQSWHASEAQLGSIAALTMFGYGTGLFLFVPLGDIIARHRLIHFFMAAVVINLLLLASTTNLSLFAALTFSLGALTIVPQLIIPLATGLVEREERGGVVGKLMSGLLLGILVSRTVGGIVGDHFGWRAVYYSAAGLNVILGITLLWLLPKGTAASKMSYFDLLKSICEIASREKIVQTSSFFGAMTFGAFNVFWTTLSFLTSAAPYNYDPEKIGLFGLVGASGVLAAPIAGRLADTRGPMFGIGFSLVVMLISWGILAGWGLNLVGLIVGIIVLDLAAHSSQVSNMARIYSLAPEMHSRINTIYMGSYFTGGSLGAWLGSQAWSRFAWSGVCTTGASFATIGLLMFALLCLVQSRIKRG